jgi:poly [ADP-ribose] polymerase
MEIRPTYLIMVTKENNNKYYNCFPEGDRFRVEYGRVNSTKQTTSYPISKWNSQINSKIKKGYVDVTDTKQDLIEEVSTSNPDMTYKEIENKVIRDIVEKLQSMAKETIKKNYSVKSSAVTQAMIDEAQIVLNDLSHITNIDEFNDKLLELFAVIPRKMGNVRDYLCNNSEDFSDIIQREQDLLDVMQGEVYKPEKHTSITTSKDKKDFTILDELGLEFGEVSNNEIEMIKKLMNESKNKFRKAWKVKNIETEKRFNKFVEDNKITDTRLLFHGSRSENFWSIIKTGLMIRPANAVYTGSMFGDGLYFAPKCQKSIGYTSLNGSYWAHGGNNVAYMALFEVAYGKPYVIYEHNSNCYRLNYDVLQNKKPKCHCLHAKADKGMLRNDEIVFYKPEQVTIKYLIEIGN